MRLLILCVFLFAIGPIACHEPGPLEKAGQRIDEAADNVSEGKSPLHKSGPLEKAGEDIDRALGSDKDDDRD